MKYQSGEGLVKYDLSPRSNFFKKTEKFKFIKIKNFCLKKKATLNKSKVKSLQQISQAKRLIFLFKTSADREKMGTKKRERVKRKEIQIVFKCIS